MRIFYKTYHTKYITPSFTAKPTRRARGRSQARRLDCKHRCSWSGARTHLQTRPVMEARNVDCLPSATTNSSSRPAADSVTVATWELVDSVTVATWELADPVTVATWELIGKLENWQTWPRVSPTGVRNWFPCTDWTLPQLPWVKLAATLAPSVYHGQNPKAFLGVAWKHNKSPILKGQTMG